MSVGNKIIRLLDNDLGKGILKSLIFYRYKSRGRKIERVQFHEDFGAWEFRIDGISYLSSGPGWIYDYDYLLEQLKQLSCHYYLPQSGDTVIDIGAGVGEETVIFSTLVGPSGKVYSIEAHPKTFRALAYLKDVNTLENVSILNMALSDINGVVSIDDSENSLANSILPTPKKKSFTVNALTFDDFIATHNINQVDLLKMNVEGAEQLIVKGMKESLKIIKRMSISCHDFRYNSGESEFFKTKDKILSFLDDNNFQIEMQNTKNSMVDDYVYAINPSLV